VALTVADGAIGDATREDCTRPLDLFQRRAEEPLAEDMRRAVDELSELMATDTLLTRG
jgi:hypothetical protein